MSKFKIGDKVKVTVSPDDAWHGLVGDEYIGCVTEVYCDGRVKVDDKHFLQVDGIHFKVSKIKRIEDERA